MFGEFSHSGFYADEDARLLKNSKLQRIKEIKNWIQLEYLFSEGKFSFNKTVTKQSEVRGEEQVKMFDEIGKILVVCAGGSYKNIRVRVLLAESETGDGHEIEVERHTEEVKDMMEAIITEQISKWDIIGRAFQHHKEYGNGSL